MTFATLSSKGQITVPASARQALGLQAGSRVLIETCDGKIIIHSPKELLSLKGFLGKAKSRQVEQTAMEAQAAKRARGEEP
jgi:AbrB family looped-hinge helix DNA binding protein